MTLLLAIISYNGLLLNELVGNINLKSKKDKVSPRGTVVLIFAISDFDELNWSWKNRSIKYALIKRITGRHFLSLYNNPACQTRLKACESSKNTQVQYSFFSRDIEIVSTTLWT